MVHIRLIAVGKIKESFLREEIAEYAKRLSRYCKFSIAEVEDSKIREKASEKEETMILEEEGKKLLKQIRKEEFVLLIDLHGKEMDSVSFAKEFAKICNLHPVVDVVIGGSLGLSDEVRARADMKLCLSKMTFPHQMTRAIVSEQIYRAFKITNNETYHK